MTYVSLKIGKKLIVVTLIKMRTFGAWKIDTHKEAKGTEQEDQDKNPRKLYEFLIV